MSINDRLKQKIVLNKCSGGKKMLDTIQRNSMSIEIIKKLLRENIDENKYLDLELKMLNMYLEIIELEDNIEKYFNDKASHDVVKGLILSFKHSYKNYVNKTIYEIIRIDVDRKFVDNYDDYDIKVGQQITPDMVQSFDIYDPQMSFTCIDLVKTREKFIDNGDITHKNVIYAIYNLQDDYDRKISRLFKDLTRNTFNYKNYSDLFPIKYKYLKPNTDVFNVRVVSGICVNMLHRKHYIGKITIKFTSKLVLNRTRGELIYYFNIYKNKGLFAGCAVDYSSKEGIVIKHAANDSRITLCLMHIYIDENTDANSDATGDATDVTDATDTDNDADRDATIAVNNLVKALMCANDTKNTINVVNNDNTDRTDNIDIDSTNTYYSAVLDTI